MMNKRILEGFKLGFENKCIKLLVEAYQHSITIKSIKLDWDENDITAQLYEYIDKSDMRAEWSIVVNVESHLLNNTIKREKGFAAKFARIDMRFVQFSRSQEYKYFIEAKRLSQKDSKLKRRYIDTGIDNFTSGRYSNGCLISYLLDGDSRKTIEGINSLLKKDRRESESIYSKDNILHTDYYESKHDEIGVLKHYVFDYTKYLDSQI